MSFLRHSAFARNSYLFTCGSAALGDFFSGNFSIERKQENIYLPIALCVCVEPRYQLAQKFHTAYDLDLKTEAAKTLLRYAPETLLGPSIHSLHPTLPLVGLSIFLTHASLEWLRHLGPHLFLPAMQFAK